MVASAGMHEGGEVISSDWSDEEVMLEGITWIGLQGGAVRIDADLLRGEVTVRFAVRVVEVGSSVDEVEDDSLSIVVAVSSVKDGWIRVQAFRAFAFICIHLRVMRFYQHMNLVIQQIMRPCLAN